MNLLLFESGTVTRMSILVAGTKWEQIIFTDVTLSITTILPHTHRGGAGLLPTVGDGTTIVTTILTTHELLQLSRFTQIITRKSSNVSSDDPVCEDLLTRPPEARCWSWTDQEPATGEFLLVQPRSHRDD
jgi:hypothetical protein